MPSEPYGIDDSFDIKKGNIEIEPDISTRQTLLQAFDKHITYNSNM